MKSRLLHGMATLLLCLLSYNISAQKLTSQYDPQALFDQGVMLFQNQEYGAAISAFEQYRSIVSDAKTQQAVDAQYYEAVSSLYLGNGDANSKIIQFVHENPSSTWASHANFLYANSLFKSKKYRDALAIYEKTNASSLTKEEAQQLQFNTAYSYFQTDRSSKALPIFKVAMLNPGTYQDAAKYYYAHIQYVSGNDMQALGYFEQLQSKPAFKKIVPAYIMQINYRNGDIDAVLDQGDIALKNADRKRKSEMAFIMADAWFQKKDYEKALQYYNLYFTNLNGKEVPYEAYMQNGISKMKTGNYKGAIEDLQRIASDKDQLGQFASYFLADCYNRTGEQKYAKNAFYTAYKAKFDPIISQDALFNYAKLSLIPGVDPFNEASGQLETFIAENPRSARKSEAEELMIYLQLNAKDYDNALSRLESMRPRTEEMQAIYDQLLYSTGTDNFQNGNFDKAQVYFSRILNSKSGNAEKAEACFWLGESAYGLGNYTIAENYYKQFQDMPNAKQLSFYPMADYNLGYLEYRRGDYIEAIERFRSFIQNSDDRRAAIKSDAYIRLGDCFFMDRNYNNAINYYDMATRLDNKNADYALFQQGLAYGAQGNSNKKIDLLNTMINNYPNTKYYDKALFEIGNTHLITNDKRSAIASFDKLIKERPRSSYTRQSLMKIGMIYYNNNQYDQALSKLENLVKNYPDTDESREALTMIRNIYMERNKLADFFAYTEKNGLGQVNVSQKDSLAFANIENFYLEGRYEAADTALQYYFNNFPNGAYLLKAHHYGLACAEKIGTEEDEIKHLEYILKQADNDYTDNALLKMARIEYDHKRYDKAGNYYERLSNITEEPLTRLEALEGSMKSNFFMGHYDKAIQQGQTLSSASDLSQDQINQINHILGKSYFEKKDYPSAINKLDQSAKNDPSVYGAESAYYSIVSSYRLNKLDEAENKAFDISDNFSSYNYWVAKSFITLADVYVAKGNTFQAKETLRSIIDNYKGEDLKTEASEKLATIESREGKSGGINEIEPMQEDQIFEIEN